MNESCLCYFKKIQICISICECLLTGPDSNNIGANTRSEHNALVYTEKLAGTKYSKHICLMKTQHIIQKKGLDAKTKFDVENIGFLL